ncbi:MAG: hypothetical protein HY520_05305 [Candidatus Aenigmarchaeota archaeon]|nr:hypothetical protein [Candidatus Aenigmarchaeota archaeon]
MGAFLYGALALVAVLLVANQVLLAGIGTPPAGTGLAAQQPASVPVPSTPQASNADQARAQSLAEEIIPEGTPPYGAAAGVSFDQVDQSLQALVGYHRSITLQGEDLARYIRIGMTPETACEFCCGIGELGFAGQDGNLLCGCAHNISFSGMTKWLIQNTDYTDEEILDELEQWKALFFPGPKVAKELSRAGLNPTLVGLPAQQGGCG